MPSPGHRRLTTPYSQHNHIKGLATSHAMWEALRKVHGALGQGRLNFLKRKFFNYKAGTTESIDDVCSNLSRLQMTIRDIRSTEAPTDLDIALTLINSVDDEAYTLAKCHLEDMENLTLAHTKERLILVEQKIKDDINSDEMANKTGGPKEKDNRECYYCKKKGHIKPKCFKWLATDEGKKYTEEKKTDQNSETKPTNPKEKKSGRRQPDRPAVGARKAQEGGDSSDSDEAFMAIEENPPMGWIIDSGASRHMTPDESVFVTKRGISSTVTVANGEALKGRAIGDIQINLGGRTIQMRDVLHVPGLDANLLSISALNRRGLTVLFTKGGVEIRKKDTLVATGIARGRMYLLRTADTALYTPEGEETLISGKSVGDIKLGAVDASENSENSGKYSRRIPSASNQETDAFRLWHERLGHVSPARVRLLTGQVTGMGATKLHDHQMTCDICDLTKLTRKVNRKSPKRASRRLGRVHTDVWGPFRISSITGSRYFLSLIDDLTRKSWVFFLRERSEIYQKIEAWRAEIRLETGYEPGQHLAAPLLILYPLIHLHHVWES